MCHPFLIGSRRYSKHCLIKSGLSAVVCHTELMRHCAPASNAHSYTVRPATSAAILMLYPALVELSLAALSIYSCVMILFVLVSSLTRVRPLWTYLLPSHCKEKE